MSTFVFGADRRDELMRLEVRSACDPAGHDDRDEDGPEHDGPNDAPGVPTWTLGLPVTLHRGLNAGRVHRATVAVHGGTASHASLQRRLHAALKAGRRPFPRAPAAHEDSRGPGRPRSRTVSSASQGPPTRAVLAARALARSCCGGRGSRTRGWARASVLPPRCSCPSGRRSPRPGRGRPGRPRSSGRSGSRDRSRSPPTAGVIANDSVRSRPTRSAARRSNSFRFSVWSGHAGYPNAGRMPRNLSAGEVLAR